MNRYVVLARFDKNTEEKLIALRREMTNAGYASSEWPPHITLAAYEDLDAEALCDWTGEFVREHTRQKLTFGSVSLLPPYATHRETAVLCLNPVHAKPLSIFTMRSTKNTSRSAKASAVSPLFRRTSPSSTVRSALCASRSCRTRSSSSSKMMFSPKPKLPRWRSTPIPCASSNGLT